MIEEKSRYAAVFISDLHLHPEEPLILARFNAFVEWASVNTRTVYILGDFFHVWPGDDGLDAWSESIAHRLYWLSQQQVTIYFMHGNRDFLLGNRFAKLAGMTILPEPSLIQLDDTNVLLVHGDRYCTHDKAHQRFRGFTRNRIMRTLLLLIPFRFRSKLVTKARKYSQSNKPSDLAKMDVVKEPLIEHMQYYQATILIHGHTHKPGLTSHVVNAAVFSQYVLSDWDDNPLVLCYDQSSRFKFNHINAVEG